MLFCPLKILRNSCRFFLHLNSQNWEDFSRGKKTFTKVFLGNERNLLRSPKWEFLSSFRTLCIHFKKLKVDLYHTDGWSNPYMNYGIIPVSLCGCTLHGSLSFWLLRWWNRFLVCRCQPRTLLWKAISWLVTI